MTRSLDALSPRFKPLAIELLARACEAGIPVLIVQTLRTPEEHAANLAQGVSWTTHSKHLDGDAIDICPYETFALHGPDKLQWNAGDPAFATLAAIGRRLGLRCGFDWKQKDAGHFEYQASGHPEVPPQTA
jgi:hypothetical protein